MYYFHTASKVYEEYSVMRSGPVGQWPIRVFRSIHDKHLHNHPLAAMLPSDLCGFSQLKAISKWYHGRRQASFARAQQAAET